MVISEIYSNKLQYLVGDHFMAIIQSGASADTLTVDPTSKAGRVTIYDTAGNVLNLPNKSAIGSAQPGLMNMGADYKIGRLLRVSSNGNLRAADDALLLYDSIEGAAFDSNKWIQTLTTMTAVQANGVMTLNNSAITTTTTGAMQVSHRMFPNISRSSLVWRSKMRHTAHFNNNLMQFGFGAPTAATATAMLNGACWRKDGTGQYVPVLSFGGSETLGTPISNATFVAAIGATEYCWFEIFLEDTRATFRIYKTTGELVNEQAVDFTSTTTNFTATHFQVFHHVLNVGAPATAVQMMIANTSVFACDSLSQMPFDVIQANMNYGTLTSPTAFTQLANYANSAAPASATLSNTAAGYTTLGGQWQFVAVVGAETDYALFGFQVPSPYSMVVKRVTISAFNMGAAVATTIHSLQFGLGFNSSAVSLATGAPYPPMRKTIGQCFAPIAAAIGQGFSNCPIEWEGTEVVQPGRFFHVILKMPTATATASQIIRGTCDVEGFFI